MTSIGRSDQIDAVAGGVDEVGQGGRGAAFQLSAGGYGPPDGALDVIHVDVQMYRRPVPA